MKNAEDFIYDLSQLVQNLHDASYHIRERIKDLEDEPFSNKFEPSDFYLDLGIIDGKAIAYKAIAVTLSEIINKHLE